MLWYWYPTMARRCSATAYGLAKVSENVALDAAMSLRVGSITKQFAAAAIMLLAEQDKLALSDKVGQYLPAFAGADSPVTIEHLLTHTSGIRNYTELPHFVERINSNGLNFALKKVAAHAGFIWARGIFHLKNVTIQTWH